MSTLNQERDHSNEKKASRPILLRHAQPIDQDLVLLGWTKKTGVDTETTDDE